jgi:hypothetical protein
MFAMNIARSEKELLAGTLEADLLKEYGPMLSGAPLRNALGYKTADAFRQAFCRGTLPVPVFPIKRRRGKYALSKDVALWLAELRTTASLRSSRQYER